MYDIYVTSLDDVTSRLKDEWNKRLAMLWIVFQVLLVPMVMVEGTRDEIADCPVRKRVRAKTLRRNSPSDPFDTLSEVVHTRNVFKQSARWSCVLARASLLGSSGTS